MNTLTAANGRFARHIPYYSIAMTARVTIDGKNHYRPVMTTEIGHTLVPDGRNGPREFFSHPDLYDLMSAHRLEIDQDYYREGKAKSRVHYAEARVVDLPEDAMVRVLGYKEFLDAYLRRKAAASKGRKARRISLSDTCLDWLLPAIEEEIRGKQRGGSVKKTANRPSNRQFRRLLKRYVEGGYDAMSLVKRCAGSKPRISFHAAEDVAIWDEHARKYADPRKPTMSSLLRELIADLSIRNEERARQGLRLHSVPSRKVFERLVKSLNAFWVCAQREGEEAARRIFQITFEGLDVERPGEIVQMDEWTVDLITWLGWFRLLDTLNEDEMKAIKKVRLKVIVAIDAATRCILAMRFVQAAATELAAIETVEMMVTDKSRLALTCGAASLWPYHLTPECIVTDNGGPFVGLMYRAVLTSLGCNYMYPPAGVPQMRGAIESVFRTFGLQFMHYFEGRTFGDIFERGDYPSEKRVSLSIDQLNQVLVQAVVDIYHHQPHDGLGGETPHQAWMRLSRQYGVMPPPPRSVRRHVFGTTVERTITDRGVVFWGIHYQSRELQEIRLQSKRTVLVRVDRFSLDTVSVWTGTGWLTVKAQEAIPEDLSIWEWIDARREITSENALSTERNLSTMLSAVNRLRMTGDAASARANLGTQPIDAEKLNKLQMQYFDGMTLRDDLEDRDPVLVPLVFAQDPLHHGIAGVDDDLVYLEANKQVVTVAAEPVPVAIKPADDISF
ncbi:hypothetical protein ACWGPT_09430 [Pseudorhizobium sp. NPDC055634]